MRVLIAGIDGYLGWPLAQHLAARGYAIAGIDRFLRRAWVEEVGSISAIPITDWDDRAAAFKQCVGADVTLYRGDLQDYGFLHSALSDFEADAIIHLAEIPSAPYSMIDAAHSAFTQQNNVIGSLNLLWAIHAVCPDAHLIKLGTMGEYGTPDIDIPEGFFEVEYRGRRDRLPFPRQAGSFYHWSKVHDSNNTMFACRTWGLRATDVMQGVVFGTRIPAMVDDPRLATRLDFDQCFGTVVNRFCCQAVIGHPLTVYGGGGQQRGFLPLRDSIHCLTLALENPPERGEYRVFNQFEYTHSVTELADLVVQQAQELGVQAVAEYFENPRAEAAQHYYNPDREHLVQLGYEPQGDTASVIGEMLRDLLPHKSRIEAYAHVLVPDIRWDSQHRRSESLSQRSV